MHRFVLLIIFIMAAINVVAQEDSTLYKKHGFFHGVGNAVHSVVKFFSPDPDTAYIEPQKYNFTVMGQCTRAYDHFLMASGADEVGDEYSIGLSPESKTSVGPYLGWKWLFLGYRFSINSLDVRKGKMDINASFYTPSLGIDVVYRNLGYDYNIRSMKIGDIEDDKQLKGMRVDGLDIDIMGLNLYYVVSPKKYSHQAAFNQTNRQIRSAGSWMFGTGFSKNTINFDWSRFKEQVNYVTNNDERYVLNDSTLLYDKISYTSVPLSVGYGYNWVFARNWCFAAQFMGALSYMWTHGDANKDKSFNIKNIISDFSFSNFVFDGSMRLGVVWNNSRWFAGASAIYHSYNYRKEHLRAYNIFGTMNVYVGYNFWKK